jgi:hypothetical protein
MGKYRRPPYCRNFNAAGREEDQRIAGENRLSKKRVQVGINSTF